MKPVLLARMCDVVPLRFRGACRSARWLCAFGIAVGAAACGKEVCPVELEIGVTPHDTTITIGQSFTAKLLSITTCPSVDTTVVAAHWKASDTLVVNLDTLTGRVTGRSPGNASVVSSLASGFVGPLTVTVHVH
jgi:hypothetical protein